MIKRLVHFALHQSLFAAMLALLFVAGGVVAFLNLPIEAFPDVSDTQVNVIALFPGRAPEEVERSVTIPLETVLSGVPHSVRLFSHTQFGLSFIMITFDDKVTDAYVRQQVSERLQTADLPPGVQPQIAPLSTAIGEIYRYRVQGDGFSSRDLRTLEDWVGERNLRMVPGVGDIVSIGGLIKTYEVNPDLARLRDYGRSLQQVYTALSRGNANVGGSKVEQGQQQYLIRGLGLLRSPDDIGNIVLTSRKGVPVHIRDVASVNIGAVPREGVVGEGTNDDVVAGIVLMRKGENPSEVLKAAKNKIVKVFGEDPRVLRAQVSEVLRRIANVPGVERAFIDRAGEVPQAIIEIDRARAARYGLNVGDIEDEIEIGLGGKAATELWEGEKHFSVLVRLAEPERGLANMPKILVDTPDGLHIPLEDVVTFKESSGGMNISRENGTRVTAIGVFIKGRDMGSVVSDMQSRVREIKMPPGYLVTWSGEFENQQRAMKRLAIIVPVSVFLIFVLLFDAFKSVKHALLILMNVPFALIGGIFAVLLTVIRLSVSAAVGFIALFGQAVLNGVVMLSCFKQLAEEGATAREAVERGATLRLRTVLMTALLAMLGLLPMALSHGIGSETQKPLAIVIIGGLVSATLLTLVMLPSVFVLVERERPAPAALPGTDGARAQGA